MQGKGDSECAGITIFQFTHSGDIKNFFPPPEGWRNPRKDHLSHRIALGAFAVLGVAGVVCMSLENPAALAPEWALLRRTLIGASLFLALAAAACLAWRWRD